MSFKVRCVNDNNCNFITKGVIYDVYIEKDNTYSILDDDVELNTYPKELFEEIKEEKKKEMVEHPSHYTQHTYEPIDVIEDWDLGFSLGNAVKYIARANYKWNKIEDLKKAIFYIQYEIDKLEKKEEEE